MIVIMGADEGVMDKRRAMSAIGTKQTSPSALHMPAFGGKADMTFCTAVFAYRGKADIA